MNEMNDFVVAGLGVLTVFSALVCIILLCEITGAIFRAMDKRRTSKGGNDQPKIGDTPASPEDDGWVPAQIKDRGAILSAVAAAIAEDCGTDVGHIRILSVRERCTNIPDREKLCAVLASAIAEDCGTDVGHIRIRSIRRV